MVPTLKAIDTTLGYVEKAIPFLGVVPIAGPIVKLIHGIVKDGKPLAPPHLPPHLSVSDTHPIIPCSSPNPSS